jgi:hypothetical protein
MWSTQSTRKMRLESMKNEDQEVASDEQDRSARALASALAVKPSELQDRLVEAKDEPPSPHTK